MCDRETRLEMMEMHATSMCVSVEQGVLFVHSTLAALLSAHMHALEMENAVGCAFSCKCMWDLVRARGSRGQLTANNELYFPWKF
jgi:hypothetical protein